MMPRVFWSEPVHTSDTVVIDGEAGHHFVRVLRSRIGEPLILAATNGPFYAEIEQIDSATPSITVQLLRPYPSHEPSRRIVLIQGLAKGDKMETIIQKNVELGIFGVIAYAARRSVVQLNGKQVSSKLERWQKISEQAASQSQRDIIPKITFAATVKELQAVCRDFSITQLLMLDESEVALGLRSALETLDMHGEPKLVDSDGEETLTLGLLVGPEGGWEEAERSHFQDELAARPITLGSRILRTETAGLVAAAAIFYEYGELGG